jgi:hypothetical protein
MTTTRRGAFADESAVTIPATGQRVYVLAATVVDANADVGDIRQRMRGLYLARQAPGRGIASGEAALVRRGRAPPGADLHDAVRCPP